MVKEQVLLILCQIILIYGRRSMAPWWRPAVMDAKVSILNFSTRRQTFRPLRLSMGQNPPVSSRLPGSTCSGSTSGSISTSGFHVLSLQCTASALTRVLTYTVMLLDVGDSWGTCSKSIRVSASSSTTSHKGLIEGLNHPTVIWNTGISGKAHVVQGNHGNSHLIIQSRDLNNLE